MMPGAWAFGMRFAADGAFRGNADGLLEFLADSSLSTRAFDLGFNFELRRLGRDEICSERTIDTVQMARRKYPGAPASLDALCRRYQIDLSDRTLAWCASDVLAACAVYLELREVASPGYLSSRRQRDDFLV